MKEYESWKSLDGTCYHSISQQVNGRVLSLTTSTSTLPLVHSTLPPYATSTPPSSSSNNQRLIFNRQGVTCTYIVFKKSMLSYSLVNVL